MEPPAFGYPGSGNEPCCLHAHRQHEVPSRTSQLVLSGSHCLLQRQMCLAEVLHPICQFRVGISETSKRWFRSLKSNPFCIMRRAALSHAYVICTCGTKLSQTHSSLIHAIAAFRAEQEPKLKGKWEGCRHAWMQGNNEKLLQLSKQLNCRDLYNTEVTYVAPAGKEETFFALSLLCMYACVGVIPAGWQHGSPKGMVEFEFSINQHFTWCSSLSLHVETSVAFVLLLMSLFAVSLSQGRLMGPPGLAVVISVAIWEGHEEFWWDICIQKGM